MKLSDTEYQAPEGMIENGGMNEAVKAALKLLGRTQVIHNIHEAEWRTIQELFENQFLISNATGTKKVSSKLLLQALWKVVNKMKMLDFSIFTTRGDPETREVKNKVMTAAVSTAMDEGGLAQCLRDKGGVFWKGGLFGDSFIRMGAKKGGFPVEYRVGSLSDTYFDNGCVDVRDPVGGLSANECVIIDRYSWGQFSNIYPEYKDKVVKGTIPRSLRWRKQLEKTWIQTFYNDEDIIEVAHYYNLGAKCYVMFAGAACTPLVELEGEEYPFMDGEEAFIPVIHFKFFPSTEGFYNHGLGHVLYDLAVVMASMDNMAYNHALENIYPINFVSVPAGQAAKVFGKIVEANEQRKAGGKGYAVIENGSGDTPGRSGIGIEPFQSAPITEEWERAFTRLEKQITRLGIELDSVDRGDNVTATQVLSEEENADQTVKQIMEFNASEMKYLVDFSLAIMKEGVSKKDKTPIHLETEIEHNGVSYKFPDLTLGNVIEELKQKDSDYFVRINSRSGTIPSGVMQRAELNQTMQALAALGPTPAYKKAIVRLGKLNSQNISLEDLEMGMPGQQPAEGGALGTPPGMNAAPTETDALKAQIGFKSEKNPIMAM